MGVSASLKAIHADDLARISADSGLVVPFLTGAAPAAETQPKRSFLNRLLGKAEQDAMQPFHDTPSVSLAGHWEIMTFALSGPNPPDDNPLDLVDSEFEACSTIDLGYGPPRVIPSSRMAQFNDAISVLSDEKIGRRLNDAEMTEAGIYEREQILSNLSEWKAGLIQKAAELKAFSRYCTEHQCAAVVYFQ
jgi:Domain of unknown function (DUF1877)